MTRIGYKNRRLKKVVDSCYVDKEALMSLYDFIIEYSKDEKIPLSKLAFMLNAVSLQLAEDLGLMVQDANEVPGDLQ